MSEKQEQIIEYLEESLKNQFGLLTKLSKEVDDNMLWRIAEADYGIDADRCFAMLQKIRNTQKMPKNLTTSLDEVLTLTRWINATTREEHLIRAFSCTCLIIIEGTFEETYLVNSEEGTLSSLLDSITSLGNDYVEATSQLLSWRIWLDYQKKKSQVYIDNLFVFTWLECLILKNQLGLKIVLEWLIEDVDDECELFQLTGKNSPNMIPSVVPERWENMGKVMLDASEAIKNKQVRERLQIFVNAFLINELLDIAELKWNK